MFKEEKTSIELQYGTRLTLIYSHPSQAILISQANIIILSEANILEENLNNVCGNSPDYNVHMKPIPGSKTSRIVVLIKNQGANIQRVGTLEEPSSACMLFKMCLANKVITIAA